MVHRRTLSRVYLSLVALLLSALVLGCGGSHHTGGYITITASGNVVAGTTMQLHATDTNTFQMTSDVTSTATWTSSSPSVATVSNTGLVTGLASGATTITATLQTDTGTLGLSIGAATVSSITVSPQNATVFTHGTQPYTASAVYTDKTIGTPTGVAWSVAPASVATIDGVTGVLTAVAPGTYTVTAASGTLMATATGTVTDATLSSVAITPLSASIAAGGTQQFKATGTYADGSTKDLTGSVTWSSSNAAVLSINSSGLATAASSVSAATTVTLTAQLGAVTTTLMVQVTPSTAVTSLIVTPTSSSIAAGSSEQHTATALYADGSQKDVTQAVVWSVASDGSAVASISQTGVDTGLAPGTTTIQAALGATQTQSVVIVTPATLTALTIQAKNALLPVGATQQLQLIGSFSDGTTQDLTLSANWQSANPTVATIDAKGLATGLAAGSVQFSGAFGGMTATTTGFQVQSATLLSTVIDLDFATQVLGIGEQLHLLGIYSDGTTHDLTSLATWTSANPAVFPVDATGYAYPLTAGSTRITGTALGKSASTSVSAVTDPLLSIAISPATPSFALGTTLDYTAIGTFGGNLSEDITKAVVWTSSDPSVLTIDGKGRAKSGKPGTATVTASLLGITQTSSSITVTPATAVSLSITPATAQIAALTSQKFTVVGIFSDDSIQDVSSSVVWNTSDNTVASVDPSGTVTGIKPGSIQVTASLGGVTSSSPLTITNATLSSVAVLPANSELPVTVNKQFSLIGTFSDGTTQDLTQEAVWSTSTPAIASVVMKGKVTGVSPGTGIIAAQRGLFSASTPVNVTSATITSLAITPASTVIRKFQHQQMVITGTFSDGYTQDLAQLNATFSSDTPKVASIDKSAIVYGVGIGNATISASFEGQTASTTKFQVESNTVSSVTVSPANPSITAGGTQQFTVTTTYDDGTTDDSTAEATWTSSNPTVLSIDTHGLATARTTTSPVTVTITGTGPFGTATASVLVQPAVAPPPPAATLTSINVTPTSSHIAAGTTVQLTAIGTYSDGTTQDLTSSVTWTSSSTGLATVNATGLVTGVSSGLVSIQAQSGTIQNSAVVRVTSATLTSVSISPSGASFAAGATQQFTLTGTFSDGSTQNLSGSATWASSAPAVATISSTGLASGVSSGSVQFTATYGGKTATTATVTVTPATLVSISVSPSSPSFAKGSTVQFTITGHYSDGTTRDLTTTSTYTSSDPTVVSITSDGRGMGLTTGTVHITITFGGKTVTTQTVTVTSATLTSIAITPASPTFADGTTQQFTATGTFSDSTTQNLSTQVVWTSSDPSVLTIDANGLATAGGVGTAHITATLNGTTATTGAVTVTSSTLVSLTLSPTTADIAKGTTQQFTATGTYSDGTTQNLSTNVTWTSSNGAVVSIDASGLATGTGTGSATITATYQGQTVSTSSFTVTPATLVSIAFTPANPTVAAGTSTQITVTGTFSDGTTQNLTTTATYTSSNVLVVSVSSTGVITGLLPGSATVTVTVNGITSTFSATVTTATLVSIAVTPSSPAAFAKGTTLQFTATGTYSDGTTQNLSSTALWTTSNPAVVTIDTHGLATATGIGSATVTATYQGQSSTTSSFSVTPATIASIAVTPTNPTIIAGNTQQFTATATNTDGTTQNVSSTTTWTSSNSNLLSVDTTGLATAHATLTAATATITATSGSSTSSVTVTIQPAGSPTPPVVTLTAITVTPTSSHIAAGTTVQLTATGTYSDGSTADLTSTVTWTTSAPLTASVSSTGLVTGILPGLVTIQAQSGTIQGSAVVNVTLAALTSVSISPSGASFATGATQQFTLTGHFSDGSTQNLTTSATWSTSAPGVATISSTGLATGVSAGSVQFTGSYNGQSSTTAVSMVTPATLVSIAINPTVASFANGTSQQFTIIATYSDGTTHDVTTSATFTSSDTAVITISVTGLAHAVSTGTAHITATYQGQTITTQSVTVTQATLVSIAVTPNTPTLANGTTQQFTATGTFSDGTTQDLTTQVTWNSSNPSVLTINASGLAATDGTGSVTITATLNSVTTTTGTVTVTAATLASLTISPATGQIAKGTTQQFTATGTFTDGTTQNLTTSVAWTTSDGTVVSINAAGLATGTGTGSATLTATYQGQTASTTTFTVTPATLVSISFTPASPVIAAGTSVQIIVTGTFTDGTTQTLTTDSTFTTSDPAIATVTSGGVITAVAPGNVVITVTVGGRTSTLNVSITNATLVSLAITPTNSPSFAKGTTTQFTVTGTYSDGTTQNLSSTASWTSSNTAVFTVDTHGLATGTGVGTATLTATYQGQTATTSIVQVTPAVVASIMVTPANPTIGSINTQQFTATAIYTDATTVDVTSTANWTSSNPLVATINASGFATALLPGTTTIQAVSGAFTGTTTLTITLTPPPPAPTLTSIAVTPANSSITAGARVQYTATGTYSDSSTQNITSSVTWSSSTTGTATINSSGLAFGASTGTTTIQATSGSTSGTTGLTVTAAPVTLTSIAITPSSASVAKGMTQQFTATGTYSDGTTQNLSTQVTWQSSATPVANIDTNGLAHTLAAGTTQITATFSGSTATATLTVSPATISSLAVTPATASIAAGTTQQYKAVGTLSDGSTQDLTTSVTWTSSNTASATINANGLASSTTVGSTTITATTGSTNATASLNVTSATPVSVQLSPSSVSIPAGDFQQLLATATFTDGSSQNVTTSVTYTTSNSAVATVDVNGKLTAAGPGTATITATLGSVSTTITVTISNATLVSIAITPSPISLAAGTSQQLTVTGTFSDGSTEDLTTSVTYTSSDPSIASVSTGGNVMVLITGNVNITVTSGTITNSVAITGTTAVVTSISVTPASVTLAAGQTQQFAATATLSDGTQQNLTASAHWSVSDPSKATVSDSGATKGFLTSNAAGTISVVATSGSASGSATITIQSASLTSLTVSPNPVSLAAGTTQALTVTGHYTDGSMADLTASATFTTTNASAASVNASGLVQAVATGSATINVTVQSVSVSIPVTVTAATLVSIAISPSAPSLAVGLHVQLTAIGTYSDGSTADLSALVQWNSTAPSVATISGTGLLTGVAIGNSTVGGTYNGVSATVPVTITAAILQTIAIQPASASFPLGLSQQLTAIGTWSDGTTHDITSTVTWSSLTPSVGVVNSTGLATGVTTGSFNARATMGTITGTAPVTVTAAILQSIVVTPANTTFLYVLHQTIQFTATGHYSDGTTQNITNSVHWAITAGLSVGNVSQTGTFTTLGLGLGTITATSGATGGSTNFIIALVL